MKLSQVVFAFLFGLTSLSSVVLADQAKTIPIKTRLNSLPGNSSDEICRSLAASPHEPGNRKIGIPFSKINATKAIEACQAALDKKPRSAVNKFRLGRAFSAGKKVAEAVKYYYESANQGYAAAQSSLAYMYLYGLGVERNYQAAFWWYNKAALQDDHQAYIGLGYIYANGFGVQKNINLSNTYYQKANSNKSQSSLLPLSEYKIYRDSSGSSLYSTRLDPTERQRALIMLYEYPEVLDADDVLRWFKLDHRNDELRKKFSAGNEFQRKEILAQFKNKLINESRTQRLMKKGANTPLRLAFLLQASLGQYQEGKGFPVHLHTKQYGADTYLPNKYLLNDTLVSLPSFPNIHFIKAHDYKTARAMLGNHPQDYLKYMQIIIRIKMDYISKKINNRGEYYFEAKANIENATIHFPIKNKNGHINRGEGMVFYEWPLISPEPKEKPLYGAELIKRTLKKRILKPITTCKIILQERRNTYLSHFYTTG